MSDATPLLDPWAVAELQTGRFDPAHTVCVLVPSPLIVARAAAAFANSAGGDLILGAAMAADGTLEGAPGTELAAAEVTLTEGLALVDPPVSHLVRTRTLTAAQGAILMDHVRLSPSTPHLVTATGEIPRIDKDGLRPPRRRREIDDLYARGRGERERADRQVEAMIEKLVLAHYAFYSLALIACTHTPTSEPYRAALEGDLTPADEAFIRTFGLNEHEPRVWPGEIELRTPGDVGAYIRVTRSGCVAVGEIQRRPYHEELGTAEQLQERVGALAAMACRLLGHAVDAVMVPHLFVEGIRGLRMVRDPAKRTTTGHAPQDTARYALALGDAHDVGYPARLAEEAVMRLSNLFPIPE